jgi:hypothetical protein
MFQLEAVDLSPKNVWKSSKLFVEKKCVRNLEKITANAIFCIPNLDVFVFLKTLSNFGFKEKNICEFLTCTEPFCVITVL